MFLCIFEIQNKTHSIVAVNVVIYIRIVSSEQGRKQLLNQIKHNHWRPTYIDVSIMKGHILVSDYPQVA